MNFLISGAYQRPNLTERSRRLLLQRARYVAAHGPYVIYLGLLLDRASLPASTWASPNVTNAAALLGELRSLFPDMPALNGIVLGRFLHRVLSPLLRWHGGYFPQIIGPRGIPVHRESTSYRLPEVQRSRRDFGGFIGAEVPWSNDFDQWRASTGDKGPEETNYLLSA